MIEKKTTGIRIHYFQHVQFEGLGSIEEWATMNNHSLTATTFFQEWFLPELDDFDWLVVMGGPMGVHDVEEYGWLMLEKRFIKRAIEANKTVIGICLGAQLIADVLGAKVYPNKHKEIGWFNLSLNKEIMNNPFFEGFPDSLTTFHWHGDMFDIPPKAISIASSKACKNQGFLYGGRVIGLQFHLECTNESVMRMVEYGASELLDEKFIQSGVEILSKKHHFEENKKVLYRLLDKFNG